MQSKQSPATMCLLRDELIAMCLLRDELIALGEKLSEMVPEKEVSQVCGT